MMALLDGVSVIECGDGIAAAFACRLMADLGAEVVKVEPPQGDSVRMRGPFPQDRPDPEMSGLFIYLNASKRGIKIDLAQAEGRALLTGLLGAADILIHNVYPSERGATGLSAERIAALYPRLAIVAISPFGNNGPYREWRARSLNLVHGGGWAGLTPLNSTQPEMPPLKIFGQQADFLAGCFAFYAALAAYWGRLRAGEGSSIDLSEQECVASILEMHFMRYTYAGREISRLDEYRTGVSGILECVDGQVYILAHEEGEWRRLVEMLGNPQWAADERFKDSPSRARNHAAVIALLEECTRQRTVEQFFADCRERNVICTPINTMQRVYADSHVQSRGIFSALDQPGLGPLMLPGPVSRLATDAIAPRAPAPRLGQHTEEILAHRLGMTPGEIKALQSRGVV